MNGHGLTRGRFGVLHQSAMPKRTRTRAMRPTKGVVIATYVYDSDEGAYTEAPPDAEGLTILEPMARTISRRTEINAIYCDVLAYGRHKGVIPRCLVMQRAGLHEGEIWKPRAARIDITGAPLNIDRATNPADMDGDHVIVAWTDEDQPYIQGQIAHPRRDEGNEDEELGHRARLRLVDGEPQLWKHRGVFFGVDDRGNFILDLTRAHLGGYNVDGSEPNPPGSSTIGSITIKAKAGTTLEIDLDGQRIELDQNAGKLSLDTSFVDVGSAAAQAAVLGNAWTTARASTNGLIKTAHTSDGAAWPLLAAVIAAVGAWAAAYATANPPPAPDGVAAVAVAGTLAPFAAAAIAAAAADNAAAAAIAGFEAGAASYLSTTVKVKS